MELHCLLTDTPTTDSSCSLDPLYDNCLPFAQRERAREKQMESRVVCPVVTRLPGPSSPRPALIPAVAEVQALVSGERGPGTWPDHSYCSCGGRSVWEAELGPIISRARGGGGGGGGGEQGCHWGAEDRAHVNQSPSASQSEEHQSVLSMYDNLLDSEPTDGLQQDMDMDTSLQEHLQEELCQTWVSDQFQGLVQGDGRTKEENHWSACQIGHTRRRSINQDFIQPSELELVSGSCGFMSMDSTLHHQLLVPPHPAQAPQLCHIKTGSLQEPPAELQQPTWSPRVPPPVPLADPSASALRSLLTSLQQQIVRQREEYEARIMSLEQRNEELQVEVVRLKANLTQQRHWYQVVQAKIVESERAQAAAELRNAALQKEMEQFFDTFGELNNEVKKTEYIVKSF
ncbi:uncharacterized protein LOC114471332 [Gouania willdenowi]|uniref:Uncharacterized LOC114471332 n=1 Tax=Gouania willdenowi TaxID=441366 RepID=A0A8C5G9D9_GOUWI|nr:uncharacterized protein LOC114471332 [Gouania willdenowi]